MRSVARALLIAGGAGGLIGLAEAASAADVIGVERANGAETCPDAKALAAAVDARLGRDVLSDAGQANVVVSFERAAKAWTATIRIGDDVRSLRDEGKSCDDLAEAVVVTLAVILDRDEPAPATSASVAEPPPPVVDVPAKEEPITKPASPVDRPEVGETAPVSRAQLGAAIAGGAAFGVVSPAAPYFGVELETIARGFRAGVLGWAILPQRFAVEGSPGVVDVSLFAGTAHGCFALLEGPQVVASGCALFALGSVHGRSTGFDVDDSATKSWLAWGAMTRVDVRLSAVLTWTSRVGVLVPIVRRGFAIDGIGPLWDPPETGAFVGTGLATTIL